jgi:iron complex outermembrane receptor protein
MQLALGRGSRSASIDERYINHFAVGKDPYELVGNPNLKAEINNQIELSVRKQNTYFDVQCNVFFSYFNDLITAKADSTLARKFLPWKEPQIAKRYENVPDAMQTGLEISLDYPVSKYFKLHAQWAYTYAQNLSWEEPLSRIPPMETGLSLHYERKKWWSSLQGRFVAAQRRTAESFGEIETEAFNLFDFRAGLKPFKNMIIGASVQNILNTNYVEFLNWSFNPLLGDGLVLEPGRNISFYVKYNF